MTLFQPHLLFRWKKKDEELKTRKQLERKLQIVERLLQEQRDQSKILEIKNKRNPDRDQIKSQEQAKKVKDTTHQEDGEYHQFEEQDQSDLDERINVAESTLLQENKRSMSESIQNKALRDSKSEKKVDEEKKEEKLESSEHADNKPKKKGSGKGKKARKISDTATVKTGKKKSSKKEKKVLQVHITCLKFN